MSPDGDVEEAENGEHMHATTERWTLGSTATGVPGAESRPPASGSRVWRFLRVRWW